MASLRLVVVLLSFALLVFRASALSEPFPVAWTTDYTDPTLCRQLGICDPQGPDGPWQAVFVHEGSTMELGVAFYPAFSSLTTVARSQHDPSKPGWARKSSEDHIIVLSEDNKLKNLTLYNEVFGMVSPTDMRTPTINLTFADGSTSNVELPNGSTYIPKIGSFGLGDYGTRPNQGSGPLTQLYSQKVISSRSYSLHIGSVRPNLPGSLVLGGYEQNRALGDVGVFTSHGETLFLKFFLIDIMLGVEEGGSPFNRDIDVFEQKPKSIWQGLGGDVAGANATRRFRGPEGAAVMIPDPALPYLYLPIGNCEAIGRQIPVTWRHDINYYLWNVDDPQYHRLVASPAYLSFVFAGHDAKNITIKIPFALLNLTLEPPVVQIPTPCFPCQPSHAHSYPGSGENGNEGTWNLGRAFLQAAFVGINLQSETKVWYLAQAPGPGLEQSVMQTYSADTGTIRSNPADSFAKTWRSHWTALPEEKDKDEGAGTGTGTDKTSDGSGLSGGVIVGIVVGTLPVVTALGAAFFGWKHWAKWLKNKKLDLHGTMAHEVSGAGVQHEMPVPRPRYEVQGCMPPVELPAEKPERSLISG